MNQDTFIRIGNTTFNTRHIIVVRSHRLNEDNDDCSYGLTLQLVDGKGLEIGFKVERERDSLHDFFDSQLQAVSIRKETE